MAIGFGRISPNDLSSAGFLVHRGFHQETLYGQEEDSDDELESVVPGTGTTKNPEAPFSTVSTELIEKVRGHHVVDVLGYGRLVQNEKVFSGICDFECCSLLLFPPLLVLLLFLWCCCFCFRIFVPAAFVAFVFVAFHALHVFTFAAFTFAFASPS